ncbi:504_t:CDS:2, partial [Paraglomus occultum]
TSGNSNSVRRDGQDGKIALLSTDLGDYNMGRHISTVGILHKSASKEKFQGTNRIFSENVGPPLQKDFRNGGERPGSPNHDKSHIFGTKREDSEILFRGNNSLWENGTNGKADIRYKQTSVKDESENDAVECSNREKIRELRSSLGKLFRDSTMDGSVWTKKRVQTPCYLVLPNNESKIELDSFSVCQVSVCARLDIKTSCNNSPIIVERISESDGIRVATSLHLKLQTEDPQENTMKELQCYITEIKQFGFHHIIVIGKRYCGMLFMDCFRRVFDWDSANYALWLLGDYFEIISKDESEEYGRIAWGVLDDGTVIELEKYLPGK